MLLLVVLVEAFLASRPLDFNDPVSLNWIYSARDASREAPRHDVLFMGDSLIKYGLIPRVFKKHSGLSAYNLGAARAPSSTSYFLLRRAFEAGSRPTALILELKPGQLLCVPEYTVHEDQAILTLREATELAKAYRAVTFGPGFIDRFFRPDSFWTQIVLGRVLTSYRTRLEVRSRVLGFVKGQPDLMPDHDRMVNRNWTANDGANVMADKPGFNGFVGEAEERVFMVAQTFLNPINLDFADRLFNLATHHDTRVYWLLPPITPKLQERREQTGAEERYLKFVRAVQQKYPGVTILDARHSGFEHTQFCDVIHLSNRGARSLSRSVALAVRDDLAKHSRPTGGWLELPFLEGEDAELVEDMERSHEIILNGEHPKPSIAAAPAAAPRR